MLSVLKGPNIHNNCLTNIKIKRFIKDLLNNEVPQETNRCCLGQLIMNCLRIQIGVVPATRHYQNKSVLLKYF